MTGQVSIGVKSIMTVEVHSILGEKVAPTPVVLDVSLEGGVDVIEREMPELFLPFAVGHAKT